MPVICKERRGDASGRGAMPRPPTNNRRKDGQVTVTRIRCVCDERLLPTRAHADDAGADMRADIPAPLTINPGESKWVGTGVRVEIPEGHFGLQCARSGIACNHGVTLANGVGVIDSGYRGEVRAKLVNLGLAPYTVQPGERICQLLVLPCELPRFECVTALSDSDRGEGGYGSTGRS